MLFFIKQRRQQRCFPVNIDNCLRAPSLKNMRSLMSQDIVKNYH